MSSLSPPRPRRHGTCGLAVRINGTSYSLSPVRRDQLPGEVIRAWKLRNLSGPRAGSVRVVARMANGVNECSCQDYACNKAVCKHVRALVALGLLSARRRRPSEGGAR